MAKSTITVGSNVVLNADVADMYERDANVIYRVVDMRGTGGMASVTYKLARELGTMIDAGDVLEVWADDMQPVG